MTNNNDFEKLHQEWRNKLQTSFWLLVGIGFVMEFLIAVFRYWNGVHVAGGYIVYIVKYLLIPTAANSFISILVSSENQSVKSGNEKNRAFVYGALGISFVISTAHGFYPWTIALFAIPIIISVIFSDAKLTSSALLFAIPAMYASIVFSWLYDPVFSLSEHLLQGTLNLTYLSAVYLICKNINSFQEQKDAIITGYGQHEEDLNHALTLDAMTSLYNHAEFNRMLEKSRRICIKENHYMTLVVADIDHFKRVNDTYGHEQGDKVLLNVADQLLHFCSNKGQVFRYGGEEFAVILMDQTAHQTLEIMEEFRDSISKSVYDFMPEGERVTISIGIYKYGGEEHIDTHDIFGGADSALYEAKNSGRNRCIIYHKKEK